VSKVTDTEYFNSMAQWTLPQPNFN
jgi:hypothetical protein